MSMLLILNVLAYRGQAPAHTLSQTFNEEGGTIGRASNNRLALPDHTGFISRQHGKITCQGGVYAYTDTSSSGTHVVNRNLLLQQDALALRNGDILRIGEYEIAVSLIPATTADHPAHASRPVPAELYRCLLEGAGLGSRAPTGHGDPAERLRAAGRLLRAFAEGTAALLRTRPGLAAESATTEDTLASLLGLGPSSQPNPAASVQAGFDELIAHHVALNTAIQAELLVALRRLDPSGIEALLAQPGTTDRTQCWEAFRKAYPDLVSDIVENFFGAEFTRLYEQQLRLLQSAQPR
jgi:predicted component of type VI protein secretion system